MEKLFSGYRHFRTQRWNDLRQAYERQAKGQSPHTLIVACSDSRVDPQTLFSAGPGELFVVRNVAALVPPYGPDSRHHGTSAALEFGVKALGVQNLVVMGHGRCGGCSALLHGAPDICPEFVQPWMQIAAPARHRAIAMAGAGPAEDLQRAAEYETVKESLANLASFPFVETMIREGQLKIAGMWFDISLGELRVLGQSGAFEPATIDGAA